MASSTATADDELVPYHAFHNNDEKMFPMLTLYCPPVPPSMLVGRYKPPQKPPYKYLNDISTAGLREHMAQATIARMWRGLLTRRRLNNEAVHRYVRQVFATKIQCWWRFLIAGWRRDKLSKIKQQWVEEQKKNFLEKRLSGQAAMRTWQRRRFEDAVMKIQRVFRWYLSRRDLLFADEEAKSKVLPFPVDYKPKVYFPWRRRREEAVQKVGEKFETAEDSEGLTGGFQFRKTPKYPSPPTIEEVKEINDAMRLREARLAEILDQPEVHERRQWKIDGLREDDFDHNAGMIQRFVKYRWDDAKRTTLKLTSEYFEKKARIIQRSFHLYKTFCRMRQSRRLNEKAAARLNTGYARERLSELEKELAWKKILLNNAALTIQKCWAFYKYKLAAHDPFYAAANEGEKKEVDVEVTVPSAPPYRLIDDHIQREAQLRNAACSRMAREMEEMVQARKKTCGQRFKPKKLIIASEEMVYCRRCSDSEENPEM
ncbi:hypothetical protein, conserved [Trypanosoma brucei gambiense DAL972]|uniref:Uncharacterized protein n=1 Tax=Trypanosoma brucei gambiense (strain MHOM/CI/86/DAL972) TaxID=679716 RepID=D0A0J3_TRYB9|nr:hypothetical protein, conserved [Trypanosoma brucei gambiense DAL972]CBH16751.1 hypothetical protein, conserved [Trypanosoma brucei gambiense DAL972]|eukprot:XP_011779015.1 hypothetical protein, conserved [Trypanosoma brucei gambiense DAL972]